MFSFWGSFHFTENVQIREMPGDSRNIFINWSDIVGAARAGAANTACPSGCAVHAIHACRDATVQCRLLQL